MTIKLTFLGASQSVTGSQYLLETEKARVLIDCGLFEERDLKARNWERFGFDTGSLNSVLLTHAHLDHSGLLPRLVSQGFSGRIYATPATAEITQIMLLDSAHIQMEDAEFKRKRHEREGRIPEHPEVPLYNTDEAKAVFPLFSPVAYGESVEVAPGIEASYNDAGHVLGSSMLQIKARSDGQERTIIFSGDIGNWNRPILRDPTTFTAADYVVMESTYGNRSFEEEGDNASVLADIINLTVKEGGNIVIPSFALERSQELMYHLNTLLMADRIPHLVVFVDSPMAVSITEVFSHHPELFDDAMLSLLKQRKSPFDFPGLHLVKTVDESKSINHVAGTVVIIAGSGMCTGGRIKHHLVSNITRAESTVLFVGYQAIGTLGRQIVEGAQEVRILGKIYPVKARIVQLHGFSSHSDRHGLLKWLSGFKDPPRNVFVTHGDPASSLAFAESARLQTGVTAIVPAYRQTIALD